MTTAYTEVEAIASIRRQFCGGEASEIVEIEIARVRVARIEYVTGGAPAPAAMGAGGFDPADHATFAQATAFRFGGPPRGQAR